MCGGILMDAYKIYSQAYKMLENLTAVPVDCGMLCDKACCKDNFSSDSSDEAGMYLYYGEEIMLRKRNDFQIVYSDFNYGNEYAKIAICQGTCNRHFRPLSCRIFPLIPYMKENSPLTIITDPRAKSMCPLAKVFTPNDFDIKFYETVFYIFKFLSKEPHIKEFIIEQSYLLDEYMNFFN